MTNQTTQEQTTHTVAVAETPFDYEAACAAIKARTLYPHGNTLGLHNVVTILGTTIVWVALFALLLSATSLVFHKIFDSMGGSASIVLSLILIALYAFVEFKTNKHHHHHGIATNVEHQDVHHAH